MTVFMQPPFWAADGHRVPRVTRIARALVTAPAQQPLTLGEAKRHLKIDLDDDNPQVAHWIRAATARVERDTDHLLLTQTWDLTVDAFPGSWWMTIPLVPVQSVTSVSYYDTAGVLQVLASSNYHPDTTSVPARLGVSDSGSWPTDLRGFQPGVIRVVVGHTTPALIPDGLLQAVRCVLTWLERGYAPDLDERMEYESWIGGYRTQLVA